MKTVLKDGFMCQDLVGIEFVHKIKIHNKDYLSHFHSIFCNLKISNTIAII
jgi:hypothetical protein